ncbi:hypothetical protein PsorP6_008998 [Peronosclerospora sorghi]|uniref:Uncharacterized protein n=1 Tax=Peronosclerospora sorghi TaxID=230839 RepID=A0ACC0W3I1_9STRA|nr:hypothetical protein PsorP6_008998 [Peronosclerospora sorghi]
MIKKLRSLRDLTWRLRALYLNLGGSEVPNTPSASSGQPSKVKNNIPANFNYRREPQMSIYDALHMDGQETAYEIRDGTGYKRPSF